MAYDLFYRKQIEQSFARDQVPTAYTAAGLGLLAAAGLLLLPSALRRSERRAEIRRYKELVAGDPRKTQEIPVMSMDEVVSQGPWRYDA